MLCPICAEEFQPHLSACPGCGCGLVPATLEKNLYAETDEPAAEPVEFAELCRPRLFPVAMLIKQTLEQHGVTALIHGGHSISVMPYLAFSGEMRVLVAKRQLSQAKELYKAYFESDDETDFIEER